jgi:predicted nucleic acid-binding protein
VLAHRQVTDAYLAALSRANRAILLTFDRRISEQHGTTAAIEVLE